MKDNETIHNLKTLLCLMNNSESFYIEISAETLESTLDLINRQKAELENQSENFKRLVAEHRKLQTDYSSVQSTLAKMSMGVEQAKAEAINEYIKRLKGKAYLADGVTGFQDMVVDVRDIDETYEEMVGGAE